MKTTLDKLVEIVDQAVSFLRFDNLWRRFPANIPNEVDLFTLKLIDVFMAASMEERNLVISSFNKEHSGAFVGFANRMASLAVRKKSKEYILKGLIALIIEGFEYDFRDNWVAMAALFHGSFKIGEDPNSLIREAATYTNNEIAKKYLLDFITNRNPELVLRDFCLLEGQDVDGFRYVHQK
jgi:hypothetical protein